MNDDIKGIPFQKKNACRGNVTLTYYSKKDNRSWRFHCGSFIYRWRKRCLAPVLPILVSVPKKKFKRAVKRNLIKRQVREAYRVRKYDLLEPLEAKNKGMLIAFLYLDKEIHPYAAMEKAMKKAIHILRDKE